METPPHGGRSVHFSQGGLKGGGGQVAVSAALVPLFLFYGAIACFAAFLGLGRFPWMPPEVRATVVTLGFVGALVGLLRLAARGYGRVMGSLKLPMEMDPGAGLNVVCWPDQRERMLAELPEPGTEGAFEPEVFRVWVARRTSLTRRMLDRKFQRRFLGAVILLPIVIQLVIQGAAWGWVAWEPVVAVLGVAALTPFAWAFIRPTYLRVAPGRVDIVRFGGGATRVEKHDLRAQPVRLDLRRHELLLGGWHESHPVVEEGSDEGVAAADEELARASKRSIWMSSQNTKDPQASLGSPAQIRSLVIIPMWGGFETKNLERAVFRAAVSRAEPGPLAEDGL